MMSTNAEMAARWRRIQELAQQLESQDGASILVGLAERVERREVAAIEALQAVQFATERREHVRMNRLLESLAAKVGV